MFVDIEGLEEKIFKLNLLINKYEELFLNMYNLFDESSLFWNSKKSLEFYKNVEQEKNNISIFIGDLKSYNQIYSFLINKYKPIGNKIFFDFSYEKEVLTIINNIINKYDSIIINLNSLGPEYLDVKEKVQINKKIIDDYRKRLINILNKIKSVNDDICHKLSDLEIEYIQENSIQQFV